MLLCHPGSIRAIKDPEHLDLSGADLTPFLKLLLAVRSQPLPALEQQNIYRTEHRLENHSRGAERWKNGHGHYSSMLVEGPDWQLQHLPAPVVLCKF